MLNKQDSILRSFKGEYYQTKPNGKLQKYFITYIGDEKIDLAFANDVRFVITKLVNENGTLSKSRKKAFWVSDDGSIIPVDQQSYYVH